MFGKFLGMRRIFAGLLFISVAIGNVGVAEAVKFKGKYAGIELYTSPPKPGVKYDEDVTPPGPALKKIKAAIDLIYTKSSYSAGKIDFLKKQGRLEYYQNKFLNNALKAIINIYLFPPFSYLRNI